MYPEMHTLAPATGAAGDGAAVDFGVGGAVGAAVGAGVSAGLGDAIGAGVGGNGRHSALSLTGAAVSV